MLHHETRGAGPAVLLVHAGIADSRMWTPLADALARDHLVIAPDLRGFGRSALGPGRLSHSDDLLALLDALGVDRAAVVAASMGGAVALEVVLAAPERVSALALLDSAVDELDPSPGLAAYWEAEEAAIEAGDDDTAVELTLRTWVDGQGRDGEPNPEVRALVATMYRNSLAAQRGVVVEEDEVPIVARLGEVTAPALVIAGEHDVEEFLGIARLLAERLPNARPLVTIPGAAHLPALERPDAVARELRAFLAETGVSG